MKLKRTNSDDKDFQSLFRALDTELNSRYGKAQSEYDQFNTIEQNKTVLVGYSGNTPVASGCFKKLDKSTIEIKRMFVIKEHRRKGFSSKLLEALEDWAKDMGFSHSVLETGKGQPEAIALYKKKGYQVIENYVPYVGIENSVCMKKSL